MRWLHPRVTIRRAMVAVAIAGILLGLAKFLFIDNRPGDILGWAISTLGGHSTVYVEGYSESKFRLIRVGMTVRQIEDLMGEPQDRWECRDDPIGSGPTPGQGILNEFWYYTYPGKFDGNYWRREVWFREGIVYRTFRNYYWH